MFLFRQQNVNFTKKSFTLLELILIVLILSILVGLSMPHMKKSGENALIQSSAKKIYLLLDYAQKQAIIKNTISEIHIDLLEKEIGFKVEENKKSPIPKIKVPDTLDLNSDLEDIVFEPNSNIQKFKINLSNNKGRIINIYSDGIDGKIKQENKEE